MLSFTLVIIDISRIGSFIIHDKEPILLNPLSFKRDLFGNRISSFTLVITDNIQSRIGSFIIRDKEPILLIVGFYTANCICMPLDQIPGENCIFEYYSL